eukprot:g7107.t1
MRLLSLLWLCWTQRTTHTAAANALGAAVDVEDGALLVVRPDGHDEHLWSCAFVAEGDALRCWDTTPPPVLQAVAHFGMCILQDVPIYRPCYTNKTQRFVSQFGLVGSPKVNKAWIDQKTSNATAPALVSNTRGRLSFSMDAVMCNASAAKDPCAKYRPNCIQVIYASETWVLQQGDRASECLHQAEMPVEEQEALMMQRCLKKKEAAMKRVIQKAYDAWTIREWVSGGILWHIRW